MGACPARQKSSTGLHIPGNVEDLLETVNRMLAEITQQTRINVRKSKAPYASTV